MWDCTPARSANPLDLSKLAGVLGPRVWFLTPQSELAAVLRSLGKD